MCTWTVLDSPDRENVGPVTCCSTLRSPCVKFDLKSGLATASPYSDAVFVRDPPDSIGMGGFCELKTRNKGVCALFFDQLTRRGNTTAASELVAGQAGLRTS
eukprot:15484885-Alexandrium_andersonii.AAC.1